MYEIDVPLQLSLDIFTHHNGMIDVGIVWMKDHWRAFAHYPNQNMYELCEYLGMLRISQPTPHRESARATVEEWVKTACDAANLSIVNAEERTIPDVPPTDCFVLRLQLWHS